MLQQQLHFCAYFYAKNTACPESASYAYLPLESVEMRSTISGAESWAGRGGAGGGGYSSQKRIHGGSNTPCAQPFSY
jgi:hypothetical protein